MTTTDMHPTGDTGGPYNGPNDGVKKGGTEMRNETSETRPEDFGFTVVTIEDELSFDDAFLKVHQMLLNQPDRVWWNLNGITRTDFTATSVYLLNNLVKSYEDAWPDCRVVIVADTELGHFLAETTLSLLKLDGFQGKAQLFSSQEAALKWVDLADLLN